MEDRLQEGADFSNIDPTGGEKGAGNSSADGTPVADAGRGVSACLAGPAAVEPAAAGYEEKYRKLFELASDPVFLIDTETTRIIDASDMALSVFGYSREELLRKTNMDLSAEPEKTLEAVRSKTSEVHLRFLKRKDGSIFPSEIKATHFPWFGRSVYLVAARDISERMRVEKALVQSEKRYREIVENNLIAVFQAELEGPGPEGKIIYVNSMFLRMLGYDSLDEVRAAGPEKIYRNPRDRMALMKTLLRDGRVDTEVQLVNKSNEVVFWAVTVTLNGNLVSGMAKDITLRKKAEKVVREQLFFIEQLLEVIPLPMFYKNTNGIFLGCNKAYVDFIGFSKELIVGADVHSLFPPDIADIYSRADAELWQMGGVQVYEAAFPNEDGSLHDVIYTKTTYGDSNGNPAGIVGVIQDITDRKRSDSALRASEARYRTLFNRNNDSVFLIKDGIIIDCNENTLDTFGGSRKDIIGKTPSSLSPSAQPDGADSRKAALKAIESALSGTPMHFEWKHRRLNGELFDSEVSLNRIDLPDEVLVQAEVRDISKRKLAENKIIESEAKYRKLVENGLVAMIQTDPEGRIVYANEAFLNLFGYDSPGTAMKTNIRKLIGKRDWRTISAQITDKHYMKYVELAAATSGGDKLITVAAVTGDGNIMTWMFVDITERRKMEQELKRKSDGLSDINTALRVLLEQRDKDRLDLEEKVIANVKNLVLPYLDNLLQTGLTPHQKAILTTTKANLDAIVSPFLSNLRRLDSKFTPMEIKVANFIKDGRTVKEIAAILSVSESTVNFHRQHIRDKLGLRNEKANLRSHLQSLLE